ncbi:MAG TPA: hypothetical protein VFZ09_20485 [Archangium sp.]|uniref:hypothetical protein n=1 Tax=Archangium sp. TaxID=1872627 RepID=UPI002E354147|nr:hypothetical protein [Archangium sp.]HEX5748629.1 hypothetical protein [Archangium sp.]
MKKDAKQYLQYLTALSVSLSPLAMPATAVASTQEDTLALSSAASEKLVSAADMVASRDTSGGIQGVAWAYQAWPESTWTQIILPPKGTFVAQQAEGSFADLLDEVARED